ncbi:fibronectin type III domain-containing protein [Marinimicrobium locisalis]|uniref:fibronectin type III domain-containing protein n=1 Tax=Marinimicrobium locisalis TaxID=546022 RepID=UPI003221463D
MSFFITHASLRVGAQRLCVCGFAALTLSLAACGGEAELDANSSRLDTKVPYTEQLSGGSNTGLATDDLIGANVATSPTAKPTGNGGNVNGGDGGQTSDSEAAQPDNGGDEEAAQPDGSSGIIDEAISSDNSGLVEEALSDVSGLVRLEWERPEFRENGQYLDGDDIGGYELRYRRLGEERFKTVIINDGWDESFEIGELAGSYQFSIAAFDNEGLYSEFVSLSPATGLLGSL